MKQYTNTHLKTADLKASIEDNKIEISGLLSGPHTFKRLNTLNWLRHELSTESQALFFLPNNKQKPYLDYSSIKNLGEAYDYIICDQNIESLTLNEICKIHYILCMGTPIQGGTFRTTTKYLEITVNRQRLKAPEHTQIPSCLNDIIFRLGNTPCHPLIKAFNIHYDLITLQPFDDFNKRAARMIMNWVLIQNGYRPILFNYPSDKIDYISAIASRANGDCKTYSKYLYSCLLRTQNDIIKKLKLSKIL